MLPKNESEVNEPVDDGAAHRVNAHAVTDVEVAAEVAKDFFGSVHGVTASDRDTTPTKSTTSRAARRISRVAKWRRLWTSRLSIFFSLLLFPRCGWPPPLHSCARPRWRATARSSPRGASCARRTSAGPGRGRHERFLGIRMSRRRFHKRGRLISACRVPKEKRR